MIYRTLSKVDPDNKGPCDKPTGWDWIRGTEKKKKGSFDPWPLGICYYSNSPTRWIRFNFGDHCEMVRFMYALSLTTPSHLYFREIERLSCTKVIKSKEWRNTSLISLASEVSWIFLNREIYSTYILFSCPTIFYTVLYKKIAEEIYIS